VLCVWSALAACQACLAPALGHDRAALVSFAAALLLVLGTRRRPRCAPLPALARGALGLAGGFASWPACCALVARIGEALGLAVPAAPPPAPSLAFALASVALAPVFEELLYRERLLEALRARFGTAAAVAATSAAFAVVHVDPWAVLGSFVVGLALAAGAVASGGIAPCIGFHAGLNLAAVAHAASSSGVALAPAFGSDPGLAHAAFACAALWTALRLYRGPRPLRFAAGLALGALLSHLGWAALYADAGAMQAAVLADLAAGHCVLFLPLGPLLLARGAASWRALPLALAVARLGCLAAGCCGGVEAPWGRHPAPIYEGALALGLHFTLRAAPAARAGALFALGFGLARLLVEPLRAPPPLGEPLVHPAALAGLWLAAGALALAAAARPRGAFASTGAGESPCTGTSGGWPWR
jgi:membrane protease YdiL (CAAX protease family)